MINHLGGRLPYSCGKLTDASGGKFRLDHADAVRKGAAL
jgi:hypothetical protein